MFWFYPNMKISYQRNDNTNFTSKPIGDINLKKITNGMESGFEKARYSLLNPHNKIDQQAIREIDAAWGDNEVKRELCDDFYSDSLQIGKPCFGIYHCVELIRKGNKKLSEKIVGLAKAFVLEINGNKNYYLDNIVVKPEVRHENNEKLFKGVGINMFGRAIQDAQELNASRIMFTSLNNPFYFRIIEEADVSLPTAKNCFDKDDFIIPKQDFGKLLNYIKNTYGE